ncbi:IS30 family transposase [Shewanella vesiculosa]|uniref:IS30 family transposase n=1 Tax=Shewanella vesiculosa TaxID=518738 RepID=UPI002358FA50|nr:IS30 family transposase [Shewanella vesiculosa]
MSRIKRFKHLSLEEREKLYAFRSQGLSLREIGRKLGRDHTSLSDELRNNAPYGAEYIPCKAQKKADKRALRQRLKAPLKNPLVFWYVRVHLREPFRWTPDEIAGRLPIDHPGYSISYEAIYRYIYSKKMRRYKYWQYLTLGRKKRMKKGGRSVHRDSKIPGSISIDLRPNVVDERVRSGDWETDNMEGKKTDTSVISATVERLIRLTLLNKMGDRKAETKTKMVADRLLGYPKQARLTLTQDNGKENSYHQQITQITGMDVFFCHAYHSWEKGTVENTIGRVRRYIPKGVSIDDLTDYQIKEVETRLNSTPRKCLGYLTPYEKMNQVLF